MIDLLSIEALSMMLLHATVSMDSLNKTDHGLIALRVEVDVVTSTNSLESGSTITERIITNRVLNIVPEITNKSLSIVQLNSKRLIVDGTPGAVDCLAIALVFCGALSCLGLEAIEELGSVDGFLGELEIVLCGENLHLVWLLMGANFVGMEKVDGVDLGVDVEIPGAEHVVFETVDWLISLDYVVEGEIVQEACDGERRLKQTSLLRS